MLVSLSPFVYLLVAEAASFDKKSYAGAIQGMTKNFFHPSLLLLFWDPALYKEHSALQCLESLNFFLT
jgi:hypothetical protein